MQRNHDRSLKQHPQVILKNLYHRCPVICNSVVYLYQAHKKSDRDMSKMRPSGGYRETCSFQTATIIYDATVWFCEKFLDSRSRLTDQMVQAARSGRQNIAEGSRASATSSQTELRLLNVARSSLEELLVDYEDYLRYRRHRQWKPDSPEALAVRQVPRKFKADSPCPQCGKPTVLRTAQSGKKRRQAVLGLQRLPRLQRRYCYLTDRSIPRNPPCPSLFAHPA